MFCQGLASILFLFRLKFPAGVPASEDADLLDLLQRMLTKDASKRITLAQIKQHPWVTERGTFKLPELQEDQANPISVGQTDIDNAWVMVVHITTKMKKRLRAVRLRIQERQRQRQLELEQQQQLQGAANGTSGQVAAIQPAASDAGVDVVNVGQKAQAEVTPGTADEQCAEE